MGTMEKALNIRGVTKFPFSPVGAFKMGTMEKALNIRGVTKFPFSPVGAFKGARGMRGGRPGSALIVELQLAKALVAGRAL